MTCVVGVFCVWVTQGMVVEFQSVADEILPRIQLLEKLRFAGLRVVSSTSEFAFLHNEQAHLSEERGALGEEEGLIDSGHALFTEAFVQYRTISADEHKHENAQLTEILVQFERLEKTSQEILATKKRGISGEAVLALKKRFEIEERTFLGSVDAVISHKYLELENGKKRVYSAAKVAMGSVLAASLLILFIAVLCGRWISRKISVPLVELCRVSNEIGLGRLYTRAPRLDKRGGSGDELEILIKNFNCMADELEITTMNRGRFEAIAEKLNEGLILTSLQGQIQYMNLAAGSVLGYAKDELLGQAVSVFFECPPSRDEKDPGRSEARSAGEEISSVQVTRKDGGQIEVRLVTFPLFDVNGEHDGDAFLFELSKSGSPVVVC